MYQRAVPGGSYAIVLACYTTGTGSSNPAVLAAAFVYTETEDGVQRMATLDTDKNYYNLILQEYFSAFGSFSLAGSAAPSNTDKVVILVAGSYAEEALGDPLASRKMDFNGSEQYQFRIDYIFPGDWAVVLLHYEDGSAPANEYPQGIIDYNDETLYPINADGGDLGSFTINMIPPQA